MQQPDEWEFQANRILLSGKPPHFVPAKPELLVIEQRLAALAASLQRPPVLLVLGATPELADLGLRQGCHVYRVDCSPAMLKSAEFRQHVEDRRNETVLCCDWRDMTAIPSGTIDFVTGDASLNNIAHPDQPSLFAELRRVTHPGSILAFKQIVLPDQPDPLHQFDNALAAHRSGRLSESEFYKLIRYVCFREELYHPDEHTLDAADVFASILQKRNDGALREPEFEFLYARQGKVKHTLYSQTEQQDLLRDHLGPCEIVSPTGGCYYRDIVNVFMVTIPPDPIG